MMDDGRYQPHVEGVERSVTDRLARNIFGSVVAQSVKYAVVVVHVVVVGQSVKRRIVSN